MSGEANTLLVSLSELVTEYVEFPFQQAWGRRHLCTATPWAVICK